MADVGRPKDEAIKKDFESFVKRWVEDNIQPLSLDYDLSVEHWLEEAKYPRWRKDELLKLVGENVSRKKFKQVKAFIKDESYPDYKHARGINSRSDYAKIFFGPYFHALEKVLFTRPEFVKFVPVSQRATFVYEALYKPFAKYGVTDYSFFEAHFNAWLMDATGGTLYRHFFSDCIGGGNFIKVWASTLLGTNHIKFKWFDVEIEATRMSGEMNTSLENGFANLMLTLFILERSGCTDVAIKVEGDDGIFRYHGEIDKTILERLDVSLKMGTVNSIAEASFCGLVFSPGSLRVVADPVKILQTFGWLDRKLVRASMRVKKSYLRAKALSLLCQYPGAPILQNLALYGIRMTASHTPRFDHADWWRFQRDFSGRSGPWKSWICEVRLEDRELVARNFNVSVQQQLEIEAYLDNKNDLSPLEIDLSIFPPSSRHYYDHYVEEVKFSDIDWYADCLAPKLFKVLGAMRPVTHVT